MTVRKKKVVTFGEIMLRITPADLGERLVQASSFRIEPGGSESNVAIALAMLGNSAIFVTTLAPGIFADKVRRYLRSFSVDTAAISERPGRIGLYWTETGTGPRAAEVFYDRDGSAFARSQYDDYNWKTALSGADWFHTSGVTCGISESCFAAAKRALETASRRMPVSVDLNFRKKLWDWTAGRPERIHAAMWDACRHTTLITGNETDFIDALGIDGSKNGKCDYSAIALECFRKLKKLEFVAVSLRKSYSASRNGWSGILFARGTTSASRFESTPVMIEGIVDRVGTGDCFTAGIIHGLIHFPGKPQAVIDFAAGLSALKHTVRGDASQFSAEDVRKMFKNSGGKIIR